MQPSTILDLVILASYIVIFALLISDDRIKVRSSLLATIGIMILAAVVDIMRWETFGSLRDFVDSIEGLDDLHLTEVAAIAMALSIYLQLRNDWLAKKWQGEERRRTTIQKQIVEQQIIKQVIKNE